MSDALLATAARLLRREAQRLLEASTYRTDASVAIWTADALNANADRDYDELMDVAKRLAARGRES